eukprot:CAMPEP_0172663670 /NCGR_PEP_ID=MMETSP1074-20121228/6087_1 /TAXON_ID=2916 /ORGANISM="Ceratium fusus, Strain PA161109" /LENGTH=423 /DNA_ID=CAMNT_0013479705 /DNA_START=59 /DNA_END=1330 /DNA_ORIENTATION=-
MSNEFGFDGFPCNVAGAARVRRSMVCAFKICATTAVALLGVTLFLHFLTATVPVDPIQQNSDSLLLQLIEVSPGGSRNHRPRYSRVDGDIETLWQRPKGNPKGVFFIAHGCMHQATDVFEPEDSSGRVFKECSTSNFGRCLGLPEEVSLRRTALSRGYVVMAVSGGRGKQSCWSSTADLARVAKAVHHVLKAEKLPEDTPVLASGASSGGAFVSELALPLTKPGDSAVGGMPHLKCVVTQVSSMGPLSWADGGLDRRIPILFVHMARDGFTWDQVEDDFLILKDQGIRTAKLKVKPHKVDADFLSPCLDKAVAEKAVRSLQRNGTILDEHGFLTQDARSRVWVEPIRMAIQGRSNDTLKADESCISERMNVAWAFHEFTAQFAEEMLDFCEQRGMFAQSSSVNSGNTTGGTEASSKSSPDASV